MAKYSEALTVIPKVLANNASLDATDLVCKLIRLHEESQKSDDPKIISLKNYGLNLH